MVLPSPQMLKLAATLALASTLAAAQATGTLRVRVVLTDASGVATPVPRLVLLVSDEPPTGEPRRVRTTADGTVELKVVPGTYVVELDEPIAFRGKDFGRSSARTAFAAAALVSAAGPAITVSHTRTRS